MDHEKGEYEMLVALYNFNATIPQSLSFNKEEYFIFHSTNNITRNWWNVISHDGKSGYVPSNYVSLIKVKKSKIMEFVSVAIERLSTDVAATGGTDKQLELMKELISRKEEVCRRQKSPAGKDKSVPKKSMSTEVTKIASPVPPSKENDSYSPLVMRVSMSETKLSDSSTPSQSQSDTNPVNLSSTSIYALIQQVRNQTGLSFSESRVAVGVVAEGLLDILSSACTSDLTALLDLLQVEQNPPSAILDGTLDSRNLKEIFHQLTSATEDSQQRSWHLWDDEECLQQNITQLISITSKADPAICKRVMKQSSYSDITMLVNYYQMEERFNIRMLLLQAFAVMCSLDPTVVSILLNSVLPVELAREIEVSKADYDKLLKPTRLLAMIFSLGEAMPITHLDQLGVEFVKLLLETIESQPPLDVEDSIVTLILSYNLQFKPKSQTNVTIQALNEVDSAKIFSEKILLLINREDDPIVKLKVHEQPHHSVLKLIKDVFSNIEAAKIFYTNDVKVLMDITVRQITDQPPNTQKRSDYLELCKLILYACEDQAFEHRLDDLRKLFSYILDDEQPPVEQDQRVIRELFEALPQHFGELPSQ